METESAHWLIWGKRCLHLFSVVFDPILFILAGNKDMHKILDEFEFRPDRTTDYWVRCPWVSEKFSILTMGKWGLQASSFIFYRIFVKLAGSQDRHKISDELLLHICPFISSFFFLSNFQHWNFLSHFSRELWGLEDWNLVHTWTVGRCIMYTRIRLLLLICPFISSFFFLSNIQHLNFSSHFSRELWGLEDLKLVHMWTVGRCIIYTRISLLLHIHPFISSFFFLSNFQTLKFFVTLFSGTVRPRRLKLLTHVDSGQMYLVYWNQAAAAYSSFYFFIFLSLQLSNIKFFCHIFLRNCEV